MSSKTYPTLAFFLALTLICGTLFLTLIHQGKVTTDLSFIIFVATVFGRLWMQEIIQRCLVIDSPRFRALPAILRRNDASFLATFVVFVFFAPLVVYFNFRLLISGPLALRNVIPSLRLATKLFIWMLLVDMSQRHRFDLTLHVHHVALCVLCFFMTEETDLTEPSLLSLAFLAVMDEAVWVLWFLDHLRRQRESEPEEEREVNDSLEAFPPASWYTPERLAQLNWYGFIQYVFIAKVGTAILLIANMIQNYDFIKVVWRWVLPLSLVFFYWVDLSTIKILYKRSHFVNNVKEPSAEEDEEMAVTHHSAGDNRKEGSSTVDDEEEALESIEEEK